MQFIVILFRYLHTLSTTSYTHLLWWAAIKCSIKINSEPIKKHYRVVERLRTSDWDQAPESLNSLEVSLWPAVDLRISLFVFKHEPGVTWLFLHLFLLPGSLLPLSLEPVCFLQPDSEKLTPPTLHFTATQYGRGHHTCSCMIFIPIS